MSCCSRTCDRKPSTRNHPSPIRKIVEDYRRSSPSERQTFWAMLQTWPKMFAKHNPAHPLEGYALDLRGLMFCAIKELVELARWASSYSGSFNNGTKDQSSPISCSHLQECGRIGGELLRIINTATPPAPLPPRRAATPCHAPPPASPRVNPHQTHSLLSPPACLRP